MDNNNGFLEFAEAILAAYRAQHINEVEAVDKLRFYTELAYEIDPEVRAIQDICRKMGDSDAKIH